MTNVLNCNLIARTGLSGREQLIALTEKHAAISKHRVFHFDFEGNCYVVKKQLMKRSKIGYSILTLITKALSIPALQGIPVPGGKLTQDIEIKRLISLSAAGVPVPKVVSVGNDYFVMSCLGHSNVEACLKNPGEKSFLVYWEQALAAILEVHRKGAYLSQAFIRNMIAEHGAVAFVDFEDDPGAVMPVHCAQARDWLLYLLSSSLRLNLSPQAQADVILSYLQQERIEVVEEVFACASKIALFRFIFRRKKPYHNRDLQSFKVFIQLMQALSSRRSTTG
ncbi:hypothetical protein DIZ81_10810 [Legionella taurinensis]|uniref:Serine/threonine protein kinase n=1 Tax=Legionella taurinensis TaxID=70611 RepID=A0A3A5L8M7_9GAMM|nr:hypothetical protein [Legionella taurinensis]MDX1838339.1 hypothetical protein [Legionella taurinensis]PUT39101.1 hypothetical protein DB744_10820 [Legionella taurinensis]PUT39555.1 hypothetical protein DB746_13475 [Legionella taurinensis]PUT43557.1 hypothetical protein DB743_10210 [Legionella taurinensis]PUT45211.1 hypothetical protein DB745_13415 [Legionella taurinensis]